MKHLSALGPVVLCLLLTACGAGGSSNPGGGSGAGNGGSDGGGGGGGDAAGPDVDDDSFAIPDEKNEGSPIVEGGYDQDNEADVEQGCSETPPPPAQIQGNRCAPPTDNECDGKSDPTNMQGNLIPNGAYGNGFDDDCDGLVDEGCDCGPGQYAGTTKECFLMPSSWTDDKTKLPVGWCAENSKGTMRCERFPGGTAEYPNLKWDGECRGAMPPWPNDFCGFGDFNCDGVQMNPVGIDCACIENPVQCPVDPIKTSPFPNTADLTKKDPANNLVDPTVPFIIDGNQWLHPSVVGTATAWEWELTGGDCDNILPNPTFGIYSTKKVDGLFPPAMTGTKQNNLGPGANQRGYKTAPNDDLHQIYPAFSLSGDYILKSKFVIKDKPYECVLKIQVRAPGIRAELCWHNTGSCDIDLHFARLQGGASCSQHGWFETCQDDCYFANTDPSWGYANSAASVCHGWGSARTLSQPCSNPRLDKDNVSCFANIANPNAMNYCSAENVNLDNPKPGEKFMVAAQTYSCGNTSYPHINVYCDGERKISMGYQPPLSPPHFPALVQSGGSKGGDIWTAAFITWTGTAADPCKVEGIPSKVPHAVKDGDTAFCVDNGPKNLNDESAWLFRPDGSFPATPAEACWH